MRSYLIRLRERGAARGTFEADHYGIRFSELDAINWQSEWRDLTRHDPEEFVRRVNSSSPVQSMNVQPSSCSMILSSVWTISVRLQMERRRRDLAMFNLAIDCKLRGCDLMRLRIDEVFVGGRVRDRATVIQKKTGRPVQFEITEQTRRAIGEWICRSRHQQGPPSIPEPLRGAAAPLDAARGE